MKFIRIDKGFFAVPGGSAFAVPASSAFAMPASPASRRPVVCAERPHGRRRKKSLRDFFWRKQTFDGERWSAPNGRTVDAKKNRFAICFGVNKPLTTSGTSGRARGGRTPPGSFYTSTFLHMFSNSPLGAFSLEQRVVRLLVSWGVWLARCH